MWWRCAGAGAFTAVAWLARTALTPAVGPTDIPFIFFFPAVAAAAWFGGLGPAALAVVLSLLAADWFFITPIGSLAIEHARDAVALGAFVFAAAIIVAAIQGMHRSRRLLIAELAARKQVENELAAHRDLLNTTLASIGDAVIVTDADGRVNFINAECERLTGWPAAEAMGRPLVDVFRIVNEHTRQPVANPVDQVLAQGLAVGLANHTLLLAKDGSEVPIDDSAAPVREPGGPLFGVVLVFRDVTAARRAQADFARLAAIVQYSGDAILTKNLDGIIQTWNEAASQLFGYRAEEIVGRSMTMLIPPDRLDEETRILGRIRRGEPAERLETLRRTKSGKLIPVSVSVSPIKDAEGRVTGASTIVHDITEIVTARDALAEAAARKDEFLAILSHELRNPLAPIRLAVRMLQKIGPAQQEYHELRDIIDRQTAQLAHLLDDLLEVSRVTSGKMVLRRTRVSLGVALASAVEASSPLVEQMGHQLVVRLPQQPIEMEADLTRLAQVFTNLLNNAAKYTAKGGRIAIDVEVDGNEAIIRVSDNGIGIPATQLPRIFEMFAQGAAVMERGHSGLGVGLALAKKLVEMHGGSITAHSAGPGQGSQFVVRLPVLTTAASAAAEPAPGPEARRRRVLVVDDNVDSGAAVAPTLRHAGHDVATATGGAEAIDVARTFQPEVAVLDIGMPSMNGYDVARRLRAEFPQRMMLVAVTGWGQEEDKRLAAEAGFDHHLTKPIEARAIDQLLQQHART